MDTITCFIDEGEIPVKQIHFLGFLTGWYESQRKTENINILVVSHCDMGWGDVCYCGITKQRLPRWLSGEESDGQCRRCGSTPGSGRSHRQRRPRPWGHKVRHNWARKQLSKSWVVLYKLEYYDLNQIPYECTVEVTNRFKGLDRIDRVPEELWTKVPDIVQEAVIKPIPKKKIWKGKMVVWGGLTTSYEKKRSKRQRRKGKIYPFECRVPKHTKER